MMLLVGAGAAIDFSGAANLRSDLQNASDSAALNAAINSGTTEQRSALAITIFNENWAPSRTNTINDIDVDISASGEVTVNVQASFNTAFMGIVNRPTMPVAAVSVASSYVSGNDMRCVHALNRYSSSSLILNSKPRSSDTFSGASLFANSCLTQVDSISTSGAELKAGSYSSGINCFVGSDGSAIEGISPNPLAECLALGDPFRDHRLTNAGACDFTDAEVSGSGRNNKATVEPGTYCGGLTVEGDSVEFKPGVYRVVDGPLEIESDSSIGVKKDKHSTEDGVSFIVTGLDASVQIEAEEIDLKASKSGPAPSFIFYVKASNAEAGKSEDSNIKVSQFMRFEGIIYAPDQHLQVRWSRPDDENSRFWDEPPSPFTSFVADTIDFHGYSQWGFEFRPSDTDLAVPSELLSQKFSPRLIK